MRRRRKRTLRRRIRHRWRRLRNDRYRPAQRRILYALGLLGVLAVVWILVTGYLAHRQVNRLEDRVQVIRVLVGQGRLDEARQVADQLPAIAAQAHRLTTGPAWWAASIVPYVGDPVDVVRTTTAAADVLGSHTIPGLLQVADQLDPQHLRTSGNTLALEPLLRAHPTLARAAAVLGAVRDEVNALPAHTWLPPIDAGRSSFAGSLDSVTGYVQAAARASGALPAMLGAHGPRRYFVGLQNEAEFRGTGGLPGAFAIVVADHGTVTFTHFESDQALLPAKTKSLINTKLDFGRDYEDLYRASGPQQLFLNSNVSPHFPYAARIWAAMWEHVSGEHVDGAIALDPQVLANFLAVTGPVTTREGVQASADNVVALTEQQQYVLFPNTNQRKNFLTDVLRAVAGKVLDGTAPPLGLLRAMSISSLEHRVLAWTADPATEGAIEHSDYSGVIPDDHRPFAAMVLNNNASGKLDYYLQRSIDYESVGCGSTRDVVVTLALSNTAPASGLPSYVVGRSDTGSGSSRPGDNRTLLDYFATAGAQLTSVTIDGRQATAAVLQDRGHPVFRFDLELPRGQTRTLVLRLSEPVGSGSLQVWRQPGVLPLQVHDDAQPCG